MSTPYPDRGRTPSAAALAALTGAVRTIPDGALVLLDGLVASTAPEVLVPEAARLRLVVLVHMPLGLRASAGGRRHSQPRTGRPVGRGRRRHDQRLDAGPAAGAVSVARRAGRTWLGRPSTRPSPVTGTAAGGELLCVAAVTLDKGHDLLLGALTAIADLSWQCTCVGSLDRDPMFAQDIRVAREHSPLRRAGALRRAADRAPIWTAATPPPTCSCWPRAPRPTGWS